MTNLVINFIVLMQCGTDYKRLELDNHYNFDLSLDVGSKLFILHFSRFVYITIYCASISIIL